MFTFLELALLICVTDGMCYNIALNMDVSLAERPET